ncbi:MAG: ABC transporter substrate-binding protein [Burkholderiales bacterium]|nr:MAG: ABC transporter substrate-binding protein [Burkholderiales bacterium]
MGSSWPTALPLLHESALDFASSVQAASGGRLAIEVIDPSKHGAPAGLLQAVKEGKFEIGHTTAQYYANAVPAIDFFTAIPFGLTAIENHAWMNEGGGQALFESILAPHNILPLAAGNTAVQMGGWFAKELKTPDDLKGVRIRIAGFPGRVLARAGAVPVNLPLGQIVAAFADGRIDAADVVGPAIDATLNLGQYAPHYYAPWHEPDVVLHAFIDRRKFMALPADLQQIVRQCAQAAALRSIARAQDRNAVAMRALEAKGIPLKQLPAAVIQALKAATVAELAESARADADSRKVIDSLLAYKARVAPYALQADGAVLAGR